jgi:uncharacterized OB-fold protein
MMSQSGGRCYACTRYFLRPREKCVDANSRFIEVESLMFGDYRFAVQT